MSFAGMYARVRIYGSDYAVERLRPALEQQFGYAPTRGNYQDDHAIDEAVHQSDILICHVVDVPHGQVLKFLAGILKYHGAYIYLTTVIVGAEAIGAEGAHTVMAPGAGSPSELLNGEVERLKAEVERLKAEVNRRAAEQKLWGFRVACYAAVNDSPEKIAKAAADAFRGSWWHGVRQQELASLVVNKNGLILRANAFAERLVGQKLVLQQYLAAVEGMSEQVFPTNHPIRQTREKCVVHSADRRLQFPGNSESDLYFLVCSPLHTVGHRVHSCALLLLDMTRWDKVVQVERELLQADDRLDLYRRIVNQGQRLGLRRIRLYEHQVQGPHESFILRAVSGYSTDRAAELENRFIIRLCDDEPSRNTMLCTEPQLYIQTNENPKPLDSELCRYFSGNPNYAEQLQKEDVLRWIEAPLRPNILKLEKGVLWGKLSIDLGSDSEGLGSRDVGVVGLFCAAVANALEAMARVEAERNVMNTVRDCGNELLRGWAAAPTDPIVVVGSLHEKSVLAVLTMFHKLTGADILIYRERDRETEGAVHRVGDVFFATPEWRNTLTAPSDLTDILTEAHFPVFTQPLTGPPRIHRRVSLKQTCDHLLARNINWSPKEIAYLKLIRTGSELQIPIFRDGKIHGVVVAISVRADGFTDEVVTGAERLVYVASSWIELAREHGGQVWVEGALGGVFRALPLLAAVPVDKDEHFYAGLATVLSAHSGLCWNRVFVFVCPPADLETAELMYTLGGLATEAKQAEHRVRFHKSAHDCGFPALEELVRKRLENPVPGDSSGLDDLYDLCITRHRNTPRAGGTLDAGALGIRIPFGQLGGTPGDRHLCDFLARDYTQGFTDYQPILFDKSAPAWAQDLLDTYPGIFAPDKLVYAFPLWCPSNLSRRPLGVVLVDVQNPTAPPRPNMLAATRAVLGLASNLFATRQANRRLRGWHKALPTIIHPPEGRGLQEVWRDFHNALNKITTPLQEVLLASSGLGSSSPDDPKVIQTLAAHLATNPKQCERSLQQFGLVTGYYAELQQRMNAITSTDEIAPEIENLGAHLAKFARRFPRDVFADVTAVNGVRLPCDPHVLDDALCSLRENSREVASDSKKLFRVNLRAYCVGSKCPTIERWVHIRVSDCGPGVVEHLQNYVFIRGSTGARPHNNRGRGLGSIRLQLASFGGDLQLVTNEQGEIGAAFELRFGIPVGRQTSKT